MKGMSMALNVKRVRLPIYVVIRPVTEQHNIPSMRYFRVSAGMFNDHDA